MLALIALAVRKAHAFELHSPGREEVDPALSRGMRRAGGGFPEHSDALGPEIFDRLVEVVYICLLDTSRCV